MHTLLTALGNLPPALVYLVTALLVAAETGFMLGVLLPGEATLLLVGFLAHAGTLSLVPAMAIMVVAGVAGDALAYRSGRRYGPRLRASRLGRWVGDARWERADDRVRRFGGRAFFGTRWVAFVRTLAPRIASSAMPYRTFAPWAAAGAITWVVTSVTIGYLAGSSYERVSALFGQATGAILGLAALLVGIALVGRWLGRNPDPVKALVARVGLIPAVGRLIRWLDAGFRGLVARLGPGWTLLLNLVLGILLLFGLGAALAALTSLLVHYSGLSSVDGAIRRWFADQSTPGVTHAANTALSIMRGPVLIGLVAVTATIMGFRTRRWHGDLVTVLGTAGAFLPLVVLAVIAREAAPHAGITASFHTTQAAVGTASICTLAWLLTRGLRWGWAVSVWTLAAGLVALLGGARLYVGFDSASSLVSAQLLGGLWAGMFIVAWTGADASRRSQPARTLLGPPALTDPDAPGPRRASQAHGSPHERDAPAAREPGVPAREWDVRPPEGSPPTDDGDGPDPEAPVARKREGEAEGGVRPGGGRRFRRSIRRGSAPGR